jgi:DNA-binding XRE family transcriptional regulator
MSEKTKFYIHYDPKTDYLEILDRKCETIAEDIGNGVFELRTPRGRVAGHGALDASDRLHNLEFLDPTLRLAVQIKIARLKRGFTQTQMAKTMGIGLLPYQRLESGTNNPTLKTILKVREVFPEISIDKLAS